MTLTDVVNEITSVDEWEKHLNEEESKGLPTTVEKAFEKVREYEDEKTQAILATNFDPAFEDLYQDIKTELDNEFSGNDAELYQKKQEVKRVFVKSLVKFFEKINPEFLKNVKEERGSLDNIGGLSDPDLDTVYGELSKGFSAMHGFPSDYFEPILKQYTERGGDDVKTVAQLKQQLKEVQQLSGHVLKGLKEKYRTHILDPLKKTEVSRYGAKIAKDRGYKVQSGFHSLEQNQVYHAVMVGPGEKGWGTDPNTNQQLGPGDFHLKYQPPKPAKPAKGK